MCRRLTTQGMSTFITRIRGIIIMITGTGIKIRIAGDMLVHILIIGGIRTDVGGHQAGMPGFLITTIIGEDILAIMVRLIDMDILRGMQAGLFQSDLLTGDRLD